MADGPNLVLNPGFETGDFTDWTVYASDLILPPPGDPRIGHRLGPSASEAPVPVHRAA